MEATTLCLGLLLLALLPWAGGCEGIAYLTKSVTGRDKVKKVYDLPARRTLVMVDDPRDRLGNPILAGVIASNAAFHLKANLKAHETKGKDKKKIKATFVPDRRLAKLKAKLGPQFATTPIDQVGRLLGAAQVIYVRVEKVSLKAAPGLYRPTAKLELKVIDARAGKRLYPPPPALDEPGAPTPGRTVVVQMHRHGGEVASSGTDAVMARKLAERIGLKIARLFYSYKKDKTFK